MEDDVEDDEEDEDDDIERIQLGDKVLAIRTSILEEKATACNMLCCYADELKEGFFPYVNQVWYGCVQGVELCEVWWVLLLKCCDMGVCD